MGAIARQVLQVKRKNSTNCNPPEARETVVGSVASRSGPREVAMGWASTGGVADNSSKRYVAVKSTAAVGVSTGGEGVAAVSTVAEGTGWAAGGSVAVAGAQEANSAASRLVLSRVEGMKRRERRIFIISL